MRVRWGRRPAGPRGKRPAGRRPPRPHISECRSRRGRKAPPTGFGTRPGGRCHLTRPRERISTNGGPSRRLRGPRPAAGGRDVEGDGDAVQAFMSARPASGPPVACRKKLAHCPSRTRRRKVAVRASARPPRPTPRRPLRSVKKFVPRHTTRAFSRSGSSPALTRSRQSGVHAVWAAVDLRDCAG